MKAKQCISTACSKIYRSEEEGFELDYCMICAKPIVFVEDEDKDLGCNANEIASNECVKADVSDSKTIMFEVNSLGEIIIRTEDDLDAQAVEGPKLLIYKGVTLVSVVPLEYDEVAIGRQSLSSDPDVDLSPYDKENITSRKHALIYKYKDKYYVRNESAKNSVHVNREVVEKGNDLQLFNEDMIILSRRFVIEFRV